MSAKAKNLLEELYQTYESDTDDEDYVCEEGVSNKELSTDNQSESNDDDSCQITSLVDDSNSTKTDIEIINDTKLVKNNTEIKTTNKNKFGKKVSSSSQQTNKTTKITAKNISICCICLNENSDSTDELVECDLCGLYVHEGCYGISDTDSKISTNSSSSTEPWFCNSCLLDIKSPECDLCPNKIGIYKETEAGRLVHAICALYTPNVAYQDTEKLWPVVLDEIPFIKWGEQMCTLCDDMRFARTGVCIKCDAGLCRTYFHVTCAQKHGLLVDPLQEIDEEHTGDPYLAYCKQHQDKAHINLRKQNYLAMISNLNEKQTRQKSFMDTKTVDRERFLRKLRRAKQIYNEHRNKRPRPLSPKTKIPRMLTTCPSGLKALMKKAELLGARTDYRIDQQQRTGLVTFSADFVNYYFEREKKFPELYEQQRKLRDIQNELQLEERDLRKDYEEKLKEHTKLSKTHQDLEKILNQYVYIIENYSKTKKLNINTKISNEEESSSLHDTSNISDTNVLNSSNQAAKEETLELLKLHTCSICKQNSNMHLIIDCDTCKNYYHINCLDPPLTTLPKKSKLYGWECSSCAQNDSDSDLGESIDVNTPRALRTCDRREEKKTFNIISKYSNRVDFSNLFHNNKNKNNKSNKKTKRANTSDNVFLKQNVKTLNKNQENNEDIYIFNESSSSTTVAANKTVKSSDNNKNELKKSISSLTSVKTNDLNDSISKSKARKRIKSTSSLSSISCYSVVSLNDDDTATNNNNKKRFKNNDTITLTPANADSASNKLNNSLPISATSTSRIKSTNKRSTNDNIIFTKCFICEQITVFDKKLTVKCGDCNNLFHVKCLDEPVKQYKGYAWICKNCEPSSSSEEEDDDDEKDDVDKEKEKDQSDETENETVNKTKQQISMKIDVTNKLNQSTDSSIISRRIKKKRISTS